MECVTNMIEKNVILFLTFLKIEKKISHTYGHFKTNIRRNNNIKTHTHTYVQADTYTHTHTHFRDFVSYIL